MTKRFFGSLLLVVFAAASAYAQAPAPPLNLTALVTGNTVMLEWQPPASGSAPLGYIMEASLTPGGVAVGLFAVESTSVTVSSVPTGVFYVRVRAVDAQGVGAPSNEVVVAVPGGGGCGTAPSAPSGFSSSVVGTQVTLSWTAPSGGCPATGYVIQAGSAPGANDLALLNVGPVTSLSVTAPPGTYHVRIVATNGAGGSVASNEIVVVVPQ
jgi:hypothetical protein